MKFPVMRSCCEHETSRTHTCAESLIASSIHCSARLPGETINTRDIFFLNSSSLMNRPVMMVFLRLNRQRGGSARADGLAFRDRQHQSGAGAAQCMTIILHKTLDNQQEKFSMQLDTCYLRTRYSRSVENGNIA